MGSGLLLLGILIPSSWLIAGLRGTPPAALQEKLWLGARLFKVGLTIFGAYIVILGRLPIWKRVKNPSAAPAGPKPKLAAMMAVILVLAVSLGLTLYRLNSGFWVDEIFSFVKYAGMPLGEIFTTYDTQNLHPLFTLLARVSYFIFGAPWSLRLPAVIFGAGGLVVLFLFALEAGSRLEAVFSMALLAFSYQFVWFSQNARGYTGLLFWALLSSWLLLRGLRENRPGIWILYALAAALGVYTHFTMIFVVLGQFAVYLVNSLFWTRERGWRRWTGLLAGFCLAGLLAFQFHALILPQMLGQASQEGTRSLVTSWKSPLWTAIEFLKGLKNALSGNYLVLAAGGVIFGAGIYDFVRKKTSVVLLLAFPPVFAVFILKLLGHPIFPRTFFWIIGFVTLVVVHGAMVVGGWVQRLSRAGAVRANAVGAILCLGLIIVSALSVPRAYGPKQDYQGALAFVEEHRRPGDAVLMVGFNAVFPYQNYYQADWQEVKTPAELETARSRSTRTWMIYTISLHVKNEYPEIYQIVQRDFARIREFSGTLSDGTIFVYRSEGTSRS